MTNNNNRPNASRIDAALNEVGESLRETIRLAEQRAEDAEEALDAMSRAFADAKRPPAPVATIVKPTATKGSAIGLMRRPSTTYYPDSLFVNALTRDWQSPRQLHRKLIASGVSKGSIYARLQRLADDPASQVEGFDHSYRLIAPATPVVASTARSAPTMPKVRKAAARGSRKAPRMVRLTLLVDGIEVAHDFRVQA